MIISNIIDSTCNMREIGNITTEFLQQRSWFLFIELFGDITMWEFLLGLQVRCNTGLETMEATVNVFFLSWTKVYLCDVTGLSSIDQTLERWEEWKYARCGCLFVHSHVILTMDYRPTPTVCFDLPYQLFVSCVVKIDMQTVQTKKLKQSAP